MSDLIAATGVVATTPRTIVTNAGLTIASFRLASVTRRFDRTTSRWVDGETNWYTVTAFRQIATNASESISTGDRVLAIGRLKIRSWNTGERSGTTVEIEATAIGHDLAFGTSEFSRAVSASPRQEDQDSAEPAPTPEAPSFLERAEPQPQPEPQTQDHSEPQPEPPENSEWYPTSATAPVPY